MQSADAGLISGKQTVSISQLAGYLGLRVSETTGKKLLQEETIQADIAPKKIIPLGNYAVGIEWNDGHASGIYPYNNIKAIVATSKT